MQETLNKLKDDNVARGKYLLNEDKRLTQMIDYINNALKNPDRAYDEQSGLPIYRSGTVSNQLLHSYPDTFCERAVAFALPEYQRIAPLYHLTTLQLLLSYLPTKLDNIILIFRRLAFALSGQAKRSGKPGIAGQAQRPGNAGQTQPSAASNTIQSLQKTRLRRDSIASAIETLTIYKTNYDLIAADDERAREFDLPINRLATMIDYLQFLDPTTETHTNLFTFLKTLATEAKRMNHRQLQLHASTRTKKK